VVLRSKQRHCPGEPIQVPLCYNVIHKTRGWTDLVSFAQAAFLGGHVVAERNNELFSHRLCGLLGQGAGAVGAEDGGRQFKFHARLLERIITHICV